MPWQEETSLLASRSGQDALLHEDNSLALCIFLHTAMKNGSRLRLLPVQERERLYGLLHGVCMKHDLP